ncbi:putative acetyltransferase [Actinomadura sp. NBRC 104412]|uniref:amino-acid N-acetyltransferase n=1 Tax=Actinomadura sp. NBRC 104412 TaxID=3032203 RepID=UPI0024A1191B|nr:amino-acid N-acetyltransferase [Actinomadura sp. NBRC 104412]GLZ06365.1 putative acetyltransferase [Actinomadura sp. NBRC 104412]
MDVVIRRARTADVQEISRLIGQYAGPGRRMLRKNTVELYEDVQEFWVAEIAEPAEGGESAEAAGGRPGRVVGCGALHVMWEDLAEVRSVAVDRGYGGRGIGHRIVTRLLEVARELGVRRVFCLTFEVDFFARHGFRPILGTPVSPEVYEELLRSYDEGVAEFLDLDRVKPNTLGNTRMLLRLED